MQNEDLYIGEFDNNPFTIEGTRFLTGRTAVMGMSGSGKSYLIGVICEELCKANLPFIIIDPEGEYKCLKEKFEVVWACNDPKADVHLNVQVCQKLADVTISKNLKLVFDTSESSNEFDLVSEFLKYFYEIENKVRTPMLLIVEEADRFAPQSKGDNIKELQEISRRGRKRGIGIIIATQRPAMVDKNILSQCGNQFIGRLRTENDLNAVSLFFRSKSKLNTVPDLEDGHFFAMGDIAPTLHKIHVRTRETTHGGGTPGRSSKIDLEDLEIFQNKIMDETPSQIDTPTPIIHSGESQEDGRMPIQVPPKELPEPTSVPPILSSESIKEISQKESVSPPEITKERRDKMIIDHFVWYPIHGKGYQDKPVAISGDFNPGLFTNVFKKEFAPLMMSYSQIDYRGYMFFNKLNIGQVLYTYIYHKIVDEYGRRGVIHHTALVDRKALESGEISLLTIEEAMNKFEDEHASPKGDIKPLEVAVNDPFKFNYENKINKYVSKAAVETLATRFLTSKNNKTSFRCEGADKEKRRNIAVYLIELLTFKCGIPLSFCTERPIATEYYDFFNLAVTERAIAPDANAENWAVINWDLQEVGLPRIGGKEEIYKHIDEAFS